MKKTLVNFFVSLSLILPLRAQQATLSVQSRPAGCWVRLDSLLIGQTPIQSLALPPGSHVVTVYPPEGGLWNWGEQAMELDLSPGTDTTLTVVFDQPVLVNSLPPGAEVFRENEFVGTTPLYLSFTTYAGQSFTIRKDGYEPFSFQLIRPGPIMARLNARFDSPGSEVTARPRLLGIFPRTHVKAKFALLATTVAAHWASFYFKNKADDNFDRYRRSGDPARMEHYLDQTRKYDTLSEIALGLSYASLTGLMYMVIFK